MDIINIKNKQLTIGNYVVGGVFKTNLINWYLNDPQSRQYLEDSCNKLENEYKNNLSGDCRIRWNHLKCLLSGDVKDSLKESFFESFVFGSNGVPSIKKIDFEYGPVPKSLS